MNKEYIIVLQCFTQGHFLLKVSHLMVTIGITNIDLCKHYGLTLHIKPFYFNTLYFTYLDLFKKFQFFNPFLVIMTTFWSTWLQYFRPTFPICKKYFFHIEFFFIHHPNLSWQLDQGLWPWPTFLTLTTFKDQIQ